MPDDGPRWERVKQVFQDALDRPEEERARFLQASCGVDRELQGEVASLLRAHAAAGNFAQGPAFEALTPSAAGALREGAWAEPERQGPGAPARLAPGQAFGPYRLLGLLGVGGMGEVYRARDTNLNRDVAIKVLPQSFANDPDRLARFRREAQTLASLNHPNIATIYGLEEGPAEAGHHERALVMEVVEGEDLSQRIARGAIALREALRLATQIAEALEAAHEQGIFHRDLKPVNIRIRPDGVVKVLDFGLAKAVNGVPGSDLSQTPTANASPTREGVVLGTAAYMSPEQARGTAVNKRTDIWAFGCVLFEMLTGRAAFQGETVSDTIASVLGGEPDWGALPRTTPTRVRRLLQRCLEKDPKRRLHDIADARIELDEESDAQPEGAVVPLASRRRERLAWASVVALVALLAAAIAMWPRRVSPPAPELRLEIATPPTTDARSLAISPDGRALVFVATSGGQSKLWLRPLDEVLARPLDGTDDASGPFWSPDSQSVGFFANGQLKRMDVDRGSVRVLGPAGGRGSTGAWNQEGTILFSNGFGDNVLRRIPAAGGQPPEGIESTSQSQQAGAIDSPVFLPDGRHFLFHVTGTAAGIYIGQLGASDPPTRILDAVTARYVPSGHLLFVRQGTLFAQSFDPARLMLMGDPIPIAAQTFSNDGQNAALSVSAAGPIAYRSVPSTPNAHFVWYDRSGKALETVAGSDNGSPNSSLSPDGRYVAYSQNVQGTPGDLWLLDLERGVSRRFTDDAAFDMFPVWSPDGRRIAFGSNRKGRFHAYVKPADGTKKEELLGETDHVEVPNDWSHDGRFILYRRDTDIWAWRLEGDRQAFPVVETTFNEASGQFSPDDRWIAYQSSESSRVEIYVQPFPAPAPKTRISRDGGFQVRWRPDGRELFYVSFDGQLMAVPIRIDSKRLEVGTPAPLFATWVRSPLQGDNVRSYMVSQDGQRFLLNTPKDVTVPITVILNWKPKP